MKHRRLRHRYGHRGYGHAARPHQIGDRIVLRAGTSVGMGKLREDTPATIEAHDTDANGAPFYRVWWIDKKGKRRTTWWAP